MFRKEGGEHFSFFEAARSEKSSRGMEVWMKWTDGRGGDDLFLGLEWC